MPQSNHKIAILVEALGKGGAERSAGLLSKIFHSLGHEVYLVTITDVVDYPYAGQLLNLGLLKNKRNDVLNKYRRFRHFKRFLEKEKIDFVLDFRFRKNYFKEYVLSRFMYSHVKLIYMVRSANLSYYFPPSSPKMQVLFSKAYSVNCVSRGIMDKVHSDYKLKNTSFIENPVDFNEIKQLADAEFYKSGEYIIAAGRMNVDVKQFDKLILSYANSELPGKGIALKLLGTGSLLPVYKALAKKHNLLKMVHFEGFQENPFPYYKNALFTVLCSKFEGSPRVLLESLACGTPVIAMDCPTGPAEIIKHKQNGLLIPENDFDALTGALNYFVTNPELREECASNAYKSISHHDLAAVGKAWEKLLN